MALYLGSKRKAQIKTVVVASNSSISDFADFYVTAVKTYCEVEFINLHPSLYLHLCFNVCEANSGDTYSDTIVIPPSGAEIWTSTDYPDNMTNSSSCEWEVNITEMRLSTDGV